MSVARAMGLDVDRVGLDHVQNKRGVRIPLTGALPGMEA